MQTDRPILFILSGLPASGKSTLSKYIAKTYNAVYLRVDTIEQGLRELCKITIQEEGYKLSYRIAKDNLKLGLHVVADSCNPIQASRDEWEQVVLANGCSYVNIEVVCSDKQEHKKRAESREVEIGNLKLPSWTAIENREYHPWNGKRILIDTANKSVAESEREISLEINAFLSSEKARVSATQSGAS